jgi:hypothetical protein
MDKDLCWHQHVNKVATSTLKLLMAINQLMRPSFGLPEKYMHQLYTAMILPKIKYALLVWSTPIKQGKAKKMASVGHTKQFETIQRLACKLITGAFCSTTTDVLQAHAYILPLCIRLEDTCHCEVLRLATLPDSHPLHSAIHTP